MSDSLATSTQLAAFRDRFGTFGQAPCVWMSATTDSTWLKTVDFGDLWPKVRVVGLTAEDHENKVVQERLNAPKLLMAAPEECRTPKGCADFILKQHKQGERSLVIVNTVARARDIAGEIRKRDPAVLLLHSRFRPKERDVNVGQGIIVSTQVIEAGVDISAHRLITDAAPWSSLVQRFGRVNRYGEIPDATIWWVDKPATQSAKRQDGSDSAFAPYEKTEVEEAIEILKGLKSASPAALPQVHGKHPWKHVLRRNDLLDLFDTSPDLSGNEIDISRFVRSGEERNCYVAWRNWQGDSPSRDMDRIDDNELCPAPIGEVRKFGEKHPIFTWNFLERTWDPAKRWFPGMVVVTRCSAGGYSVEGGWDVDEKRLVEEAKRTVGEAEPGYWDDPRTWVKYRQTLLEHTQMVVSSLHRITEALPGIGLDSWLDELKLAATKHDWGKAHPVMQKTLHQDDDSTDILAKSKGPGRHSRMHFRHELGSALAMLETGDSNLAAYLVAAHHGRVRVTLRSMPGEGEGFVRGIQDGETLPGCRLTKALQTADSVLRLGTVSMGWSPDETASWTDRMIRLRDEDDLGPFRLAFLEMLLRAADEAASDEAGRIAECAP